MPDTNQRLFSDQVRHLYANQNISLVANLVNSLIIVLLFRSLVSLVTLLAWFAAVFIINLARLALARRYFADQSGEQRADRWALRNIIGLVLSGLVWGSAGLLFFPPQSIPHQCFLAFTLGGMVAGAAGSTATVRHVFPLYLGATLLPITVKFLLAGSAVQTAMAVMLLIFSVFCLILSTRVRAIISESLLTAYAKEEEVRERGKAEEQLRNQQERLENIVAERTEELTRQNKALAEEIARRLETEQALRQERDKLESLTRTLAMSEKKFRTLFDSVHDAILIKDLGGRLIEANRAACDRLGYSRQELLALPPDSFIAPPYNGQTGQRRQQVQEYGEVIFESAHLAKDGTVIPVELSIKKIVYDEQPATLGVARDISERKKREADNLRTQKLESLGVLAGGIAHDFNNLLTAILGNISLARLTVEPDSTIGGTLAGTEKAALRARTLTQQLLTFSRGGAPIKESSSLRDMIRESADFAVRGSQAVCRYDLPDHLWLVDADRGQLSQVFQNLALNAAQAMPGGGEILISGRNIEISPNEIPSLAPGRYLQISLQDKGVGIAEDDLGKIFDPYFSTRENGSGLGLAVAHSIIKNHGGHITVASGLGKGTTFAIYLPAGQSDQQQEMQPENRLPAGKGRVLVMDDDEMIQEVASHMLRSLGYEIGQARDGAEAIIRYVEAQEQGTPYDVVIMDLTVPGGMGGEETIARLRTIDPAVRAVVASGYATNAVMANHEEYGFQGVVPKPFTVQDLARVLSEVLEDKGTTAR
ncbi:MAG: PAS domain S-box protein [Thermodesulfobacteriota bacterium]